MIILTIVKYKYNKKFLFLLFINIKFNIATYIIKIFFSYKIRYLSINYRVTTTNFKINRQNLLLNINYYKNIAIN